MDIETAEPRQVQNGWWQDLSVSDDDNQIGVEPSQFRNKFLVTCPRGLKDRKTQLFRQTFNRRRRELKITALGFVGLRDHADHGERFPVGQFIEAGAG